MQRHSTSTRTPTRRAALSLKGRARRSDSELLRSVASIRMQKGELWRCRDPQMPLRDLAYGLPRPELFAKTAQHHAPTEKMPICSSCRQTDIPRSPNMPDIHMQTAMSHCPSDFSIFEQSSRECTQTQKSNVRLANLRRL